MCFIKEGFYRTHNISKRKLYESGSNNIGVHRCLLPRQIRTRKACKARKHGTFGTT